MMRPGTSAVLLALSVVVLFSSCVSIPDDLSVIESPNVEISISRGSAMAHAVSDPIDVYVIGNNIDSGVGSFIVSISNMSAVGYNFNDSDISIWGSHSNDGGWKRLANWDAKAFYEEAVREYRTEVFLTTFAGVMNTVSTSMGSYSSSNVYTPYGSATVTTRTYNPGAVAASAYYAQASTESVKRSGQAYIDYLESNLLYSSTIKPGETYIGWVYFETGRDYFDYYKVELNNSRSNYSISFILEKTENR